MSTVTLDQVRERARFWHNGRLPLTASPYRMGLAAFDLGAEISINPYPPGSGGFHAFVKGFLFARDYAAAKEQS